jgi:xylulokinase
VSVLTLDLGTSATKAALWEGDRLVAMTRSPVETAHPQPGWAEQHADDWWRSVVEACRQLCTEHGPSCASIEAIGFAAARETFVLVDESLAPLGPGLLWSDRRAGRQAQVLGDAAAFRAGTGVALGPSTQAARMAWVADEHAGAFERARWVLAPRDLVIARLTGVIATDETLASRTGLSELSGDWLPEASERYGRRLPSIVRSDAIVGPTLPDAARELGLPPGISVVIGAGDRACEVLGVDATPGTPMVSWGTTANVSVPHPGPVEALPAVAQVSRGALGGFVVEAGLSAAGAALGWLARRTGQHHGDLLVLAADVAPGAGGVLALPWLAGARAPWWRPGVHAAFIGLTDAHGPAELARAVVEGVAFDVARCLQLVDPEAQQLALAGGGAASELWRSILAAVTGRTVVRRAVDDAASVGARLVVAHAVGEALDVDTLSPVVAEEPPNPGWVSAYGAIRDDADAAASAVLGLSPG